MQICLAARIVNIFLRRSNPTLRTKYLMPYKAIIFDLFGVLVPYDPEPLRRLKEHWNSLDDKNEFYFGPDEINGLETGKISLEEHEPCVKDAVSKMIDKPDPEMFSFSKYAKYNGTREIMYEAMLDAVLKLKQNGYKTAILTVNAWVNKEKTVSTLPIDTSCFDIIVESCKVGLAKPDKKFLELVLQKLECKPEEAIYLDDMAVNVAAAEELGISTIHVTNQEEAARQLLKSLNLD